MTLFAALCLVTGSARADAPMCGELAQSIEAPPIHKAAHETFLVAPDCGSDAWNISAGVPIQPRNVMRGSPTGNDHGCFGAAACLRPSASPRLSLEAVVRELARAGFGSALERPPRPLS
jgi:hypothetical protein